MRNYEINVNTGVQRSLTQVNYDVPSNTSPSPELKSGGNLTPLVYAAGLQLAKQATRQYLGRIGDRTGRRQLQNEIDNVSQVADYTINIASGAAAGFAVGNVPGAIVGAVLSGGKIAYDRAIAIQDYELDISVTNQNREYLRQISTFGNNNKRSDGNQ